MKRIALPVALILAASLIYLVISGLSPEKHAGLRSLQLRCMKGDTSGICEDFKESLEKCLKEEYTLRVVYVPKSYLTFDGRVVPYAVKEEGVGIFPAPSPEYACKRWGR